MINPGRQAQLLFSLICVLAITTVVAAKGAADAQTLARYRHAWARAAERTTHGTPIVLESKDFAD